MRKKLLSTIMILSLVMAGGCGKDAEVPENTQTIESAAEASTETVEEKNEEVLGAKKESAAMTINIDGLDISFPATREDAEKYIESSGFELKNDDRVEITGYKNGTNGFITFVFLDLDPDVCTAIKVQELPVVCADLWDSGNDDFDTLNNKVEDTSSNYHPVFTGIGSDEKRLGIKQKDAGFCYYFRYKDDELTHFHAFINKDEYDKSGDIRRTFDFNEGDYLSSTDIEGLYIFSPREGHTFSTTYYYREGLKYKMDKALVCLPEKRDYSYTDIENFDNLYVAKDEKGEIKEIFESGLSNKVITDNLKDYEEYSKKFNVKIEPEGVLDELLPPIWHKYLLYGLGGLLSDDMNGATFRINKTSIKKDCGYDDTQLDFKVTIDEYPDVMILVSLKHDYDSIFGMTAKAANIIKGKQFTLSINNTDAIAIFDPEDIKDFDDFYNTSNEYEDLPTTYNIHEYRGCTATYIPGTTNLLIEDKDGNPVAIYLGDVAYDDYNKVPIINYDEVANYPHASELDGLDFSIGVDAEGNVVFIN